MFHRVSLGWGWWGAWARTQEWVVFLEMAGGDLGKSPHFSELQFPRL